MSEFISTTNLSLKEAIMPVIAFFDMLDHPLTGYEIWMQSGKKYNLNIVLEYLQSEIKNNRMN